MMFISVFTIKESPRWLASKGKISEAHENLAYLRRGTLESVNDEMIEIIAAVDEEKESREGLNNRNAFYEAFFGKGNLIRFIIAFVIFLGQQLTGQNTINYYGPQIFESVSRFIFQGRSRIYVVRLDTKVLRTLCLHPEFMVS